MNKVRLIRESWPVMFAPEKADVLLFAECNGPDLDYFAGSIETRGVLSGFQINPYRHVKGVWMRRGEPTRPLPASEQTSLSRPKAAPRS
ncbi:MAG: hypothetical protein LC754_10220 [Acidobacteria bacterium]|nr:hypothetical protein [Acidobacteriota bacterium]